MLHVSMTSRLLLKGNLAEVFELFEPLGEQKWAESWKPVFVHPQSGNTEEGMVFTTLRQEKPSVWTVGIYEPAKFHLEYVQFNPDSHVTRIIIRCSHADTSETAAEVTYTLTALCDMGTAAVTEMSQASFEHRLSNWETAINFYLGTGHCLKHHPND